MKPLRMLAAAFTMLGLAACYTSDGPLLTDQNSVAPFAAITFTPRGDGGKPMAFTLEDGHYLTRGDEHVSRLHLMPVEDNDYVAQLSGEKPDELLYGYIRIAPETATAEVWMNQGDKAEGRPGLRPCRSSVCIDDLDAYIRYAKEATATPSTMVMDVTIER